MYTLLFTLFNYNNKIGILTFLDLTKYRTNESRNLLFSFCNRSDLYNFYNTYLNNFSKDLQIIYVIDFIRCLTLLLIVDWLIEVSSCAISTWLKVNDCTHESMSIDFNNQYEILDCSAKNIIFYCFENEFCVKKDICGIIFSFRLNESVVESNRLLMETCEEQTFSVTGYRDWFRWFKHKKACCRRCGIGGITGRKFKLDDQWVGGDCKFRWVNYLRTMPQFKSNGDVSKTPQANRNKMRNKAIALTIYDLLLQR